MNADNARFMIWEELRPIARADSRFGWDFAEFIADYAGSDKMADLLRQTDHYKNAEVIFCTPDANLETFREYIIRDGKTLLITSCGIKRGFFVVEKGMVPEGQESLASVMDGVQRFWKHVTIQDIKEKYSNIGLMITGASAIAPNGIRFGKGHGYFDLEWAMMYSNGIVNIETPVYAAVHDCQIVDIDLEVEPHDTAMDFIATPTKIIPTTGEHKKPTIGIVWGMLNDDMLGDIPPLQELWHKICCK